MSRPAMQSLFKQQVYDHCFFLISEKINGLQQQLADLREMVAAETKSTAGDKYETARAMIHIEQEQINRQLAEVQSQQASLAKIDLSAQSGHVIRGSCVRTDNGTFFLSISLGKISIDDQLVFVVSPQSPLGAKLLGGKAGDVVTVNGTSYLIAQVL